jgi:hypothetical protein
MVVVMNPSKQAILQIADYLNGSQYPFEPLGEVIELAKQYNIVIIFGASDDLVELRGAIYEEVGAWEGTTVYVNQDGLFKTDCNCDCQYSQAAKNTCKKIQAIWGQNDISWQYQTTIPHEKFNVYEDEELYCVGIVFSLSDLGDMS